ncbi:class II aaRS and biotin synthetase [Parathielavia hyrcaniae]|uniref:Lysyl-tRNA synthetase n=1 Tax=Parathielavia hyrcaniae TaxID=113614 RepID=A0AAN6T1L3_9PEZI|nr:class II aaRS and biotin synthetase [Parathielavia hyrcaniae]
MRPTPSLQFLRPYLWKPAAPPNPAYLRFFHLARQQELEQANALKYPRLRHNGPPMRIPDFRAKYADIELGAVADEEVTLHGRVESVRRAGNKLVFLDLKAEFECVQGICNFGRLSDGTTIQTLKDLARLLNRGDIIAIRGRATRTPAGELTIQATHLPEVLTPSIVPLPTKLVDEESRTQHPHLDMLVNQRTTDILRLRSSIIRYLRDFLHDRAFLEFQTPILAADAGGANARPFTVSAKTVSKDLSLRIAPELWLKRLVVGGVDRVFELGPAFRNEGIDQTHNPEFTICEFYHAYANLADLISLTENLIRGAAAHCQSLIATKLTSLPPIDLAAFQSPFQQAEFIPALESALGFTLPDLTSPTALQDLLTLLKTHNIPLDNNDNDRNIPPPTSLPQLLDRLAASYIEPLSATAPLFITHHPVCMSPLAKSFTCPRTGQQVSARTELFMGGRELANMYEEENDPYEQRRKFVEQAAVRVRREAGGVDVGVDESECESELVIDEGYVHALASGLPPTGGWGCGVERLVMLFSGTRRIGDCLSFGTLRNVVGLASTAAGAGGSKGVGVEGPERGVKDG